MVRLWNRDGRDDPGRKRPWQVLVAEAFLVFILMVYFAKLCVLSMGIIVEIPGSGEHRISWNLLVFFVEIFMLFVTADAMLGLSSRRPAGWKKAVRGSMILLLFTLIGWHSDGVRSVSTLMTINPEIIIPLVILVIVLMYFPKVRDFYVPPMESRRPLWEWFKFSFASELYPPGKYRIVYPEGDERNAVAVIEKPRRKLLRRPGSE